MEEFLNYLDWRMDYCDDVCNTDMIRVAKNDLGDLDPYEAIRLLAERHPEDCYAWEPFENEWEAGAVVIGRNIGPEEFCSQCGTPFPLWTNMVDVPCEEHEPTYTLDDLNAAYEKWLFEKTASFET